MGELCTFLGYMYKKYEQNYFRWLRKTSRLKQIKENNNAIYFLLFSNFGN